MRQVRKLSLQNAAGQRFGLNGQSGVYASNLEGFGFSLDSEFANLSRGFFRIVDAEAEPQHPVPFTVTFTKNAYQTYRQFVDWLFAAGSLTLVYQPFGDGEFYRNVTVSSVQKSELTVGRWLECACSFLCLTPWYRPAPTVLNLESSGADESMRYDYCYSESLRYGADSSAAMSSIVAGAGHIPGALEVAYRGAIINPSIRLAGNISGRTYGTCSVEAVLEASETLKLSTRYEHSAVTKVAADGTETDLLDALELGTNPFFRIPVDEPCTIYIESDSPFAGAAELLIYYYYRSV